MPDYATISTARYIAKYNSNGHNHTVQLRYVDRITAETEGPILLTALGSAITSLLPSDFRWLDANVYEAGEEVSAPTSAPGAPSPAPAGTTNAAEAPNKIQFVGRTAAGTMTYLNIFGITLSAVDIPGLNFRWEVGEAAAVGTAVTLLNGSADLLGIDNNPVLWKSYANFAVSGVWQRKIRR